MPQNEPKKKSDFCCEPVLLSITRLAPALNDIFKCRS